MQKEVGETDGGGLAKRDLILRQAVTLFNDRGYHDTRLEDVSQRLGTAKTSISYHFTSKEALLCAAYEASCGLAEAELALAAQAPTGLDRIRKWVRGVAHLHGGAMGEGAAPLAVVRDPDGLADKDRAAIETRLRAQAEALLGFVREGRADGSIRVASAPATAFFLLSIPQWVGRWLGGIAPRDHDSAVNALIGLLCDGLASDRDRRFFAPVRRSDEDSENFIFDRAARNAMKVEAFLRVGTRHLNRRGYRSLSLNDIAADLGVTRGSFYYHVADKDELLARCVERSAGLMEKALEEGAREVDGLARLHASLSILFDGHMNDVDPLIRASLLPSLPDKKRPVAVAQLKRITAGFGELVARGIEDGSIRPNDLDAIEQLLFGALMAATQNWYHRLGLPDQSRNEDSPIGAQSYFEPLLSGIAAR